MRARSRGGVGFLIRGDRVQIATSGREPGAERGRSNERGSKRARESCRSVPSKARRAAFMVAVRDSGTGDRSGQISSGCSNPSTRRRPAESGMGLAICRSILSGPWGPVVGRRTMRPRGAVFRFTLPAAQVGPVDSVPAACRTGQRNEGTARDGRRPPACRGNKAPRPSGRWSLSGPRRGMR